MKMNCYCVKTFKIKTLFQHGQFSDDSGRTLSRNRVWVLKLIVGFITIFVIIQTFQFLTEK